MTVTDSKVNPQARKKVYLSPGGAFRVNVMKLWRYGGYIGTNDIKEADIICWLGGADIDPQLYNQKQLPVTYTSPLMDKYDVDTWTDPAVEGKFKVGICRGGQFLNVMNGGGMWQDVDGHNRDHSVFDRKLRKNITVTSLHHQMMIPDLARGEVLAFTSVSYKKLKDDYEWKKGALSCLNRSWDERQAANQDTEVVWYPDTRSLCWQPHPELDEGEGRQYFFDTLETYLGKA